MNENNEALGLAFPTVVFIDTNVMRKLKINLKGGELASLVAELSRSNLGKVVLPHIVAEEYLAFIIKEGGDRLSRAQQFKDLYPAEWGQIRIPSREREAASEAMRSRALAFIGEAGIEIGARPDVDIEETTRRAVQKIAPFESENRGFKDELVVLGMLTVLASGDYGSTVLVSDDDVFQREEVRKRFAIPFRVVQTLQEVKETILASMRDETRRAIEAWESGAEELARAHWDEIRDEVIRSTTQDGVPDDVLHQYGSDLSESRFYTPRRLIRVEPLEIGWVSVGKVNEELAEAQITVAVNCKIVFEVDDWLAGAFRRGRITTIGKEPNSLSEALGISVRELPFIRYLTVEAVANFGGGRWSDFKIMQGEG